MKAFSVLEIKQIFASYDNPVGNAVTEKGYKNFKKKMIWIKIK
ncbi:MAG: hypothetical protein ACUZ77_02110 [Candidatus Brocadiales bacterium]